LAQRDGGGECLLRPWLTGFDLGSPGSPRQHEPALATSQDAVNGACAGTHHHHHATGWGMPRLPGGTPPTVQGLADWVGGRRPHSRCPGWCAAWSGLKRWSSPSAVALR